MAKGIPESTAEPIAFDPDGKTHDHSSCAKQAKNKKNSGEPEFFQFISDESVCVIPQRFREWRHRRLLHLPVLLLRHLRCQRRDAGDVGVGWCCEDGVERAR